MPSSRGERRGGGGGALFAALLAMAFVASGPTMSHAQDLYGESGVRWHGQNPMHMGIYVADAETNVHQQVRAGFDGVMCARLGNRLIINWRNELLNPAGFTN